jgi:hypothetical protein
MDRDTGTLSSSGTTTAAGRGGAGLLILVLLLIAPGTVGATRLKPRGAVPTVAVEVAGKVYTYVSLSAGEPLVIPVEGPAVFEAIVRWRFVGQRTSADLDIEFVLDGTSSGHHVFRARPGTTRYPDHPDWVPGRAERLVLPIPSGTHVVEMRLSAPSEGTLDVNPISNPPDVLPWRVETDASFRVLYDSNIFRFADEDIDDFLDGEGGDRYDGETVDDLRIDPTVRASFVKEEPGVLSRSLGLSAGWRLASVNGEKSFAKLGVAFRERRTDFAYLAASYSAIPAYHVRDLWDADTSEYRSCDFRKHALRLEIGSDRSLPVDVAGFWTYENYGYDPDFVEYDAEARTIGAQATARPARGLRIDLTYALRRSESRGYDEVGETRETSDESDLTYDQDEYELRARWEAGEWWGHPAVLSLRGKLNQRFYLSEKGAEADPRHAGRDDTYLTVSGVLALRLTETTTLEALVEHRQRTSTSEVLPDIGDDVNFSAQRVGLAVILEGVRFLD